MLEERELAALIVRNITDIESAYLHADGELTERLWKEMIEVVDASIPESWEVRGDKSEYLRIAPSRGTSEAVVSDDAPDFYFDLVEDFHLDNVDHEIVAHTWIAAAVGSDPMPSVLAFRLEFPKPRGVLTKFKRILQHERQLVAHLRVHDIERDETGKSLLRRVRIDAEELAKAFENNDFENALDPLRRAVEDIVAAEPQLSKLIDLLKQ